MSCFLLQIVDLCTYKNNSYALSVMGSHAPTTHSFSMFGDEGTEQTWERNPDGRGVFAVQEGGTVLATRDPKFIIKNAPGLVSPICDS